MKKSYTVKLENKLRTREVTFYEKSVYTDCSPERIKRNEETIIPNFFKKRGPFEEDFVSIRLTSYGAEDLKNLLTAEGISDLMDMPLEIGTFQDLLDRAPLYSGTKVKIRIQDVESGMTKVLYPVIFIKESEGCKESLPEFRVIALDEPKNRYMF